MSKQATERFEQIGTFDQYLTQLDLELHPLWAEAWAKQDRKLLDKVLYDLGVDISYGYTEEVATVRARRADIIPSKQIVTGMLIRFKERTDKAWMDSMMDITDVLRNTTGSIARTGMVLSLNNRIQNTFDETED